MDTKKTLIILGSLLAVAGLSYGGYVLYKRTAKAGDSDVDAIFKAFNDAKKKGSKMDALEGLSADRKALFYTNAKKYWTKKDAKSFADFFSKYGTTAEKDIPPSVLSNFMSLMSKLKMSN